MGHDVLRVYPMAMTREDRIVQFSAGVSIAVLGGRCAYDRQLLPVVIAAVGLFVWVVLLPWVASGPGKKGRRDG